MKKKSPPFSFNIPDVRRIADFLAIFASAFISKILVSGFSFSALLVLGLLAATTVQFISFLPIMLKERFWRNVSAYEAIRFFRNSLISASVFLIMDLAFVQDAKIASWIFVNLLTTVFALCGIRLARRMLFEIQSKRLNLEGQPTLIYGTESSAHSLAQRFKSDPSLGIRVVGYIDDDASKVGRLEKGLPVLGTPDNVPALLKSHAIQKLILAKTMKNGEQLRSVLQEAHLLRVQTKMVTEMGLKNNQDEGSELFRDINLQDLLQRPRVEVDLASTEALITGKVALVSGAGGSIGSELVRQIVKMNPSKIIALDHSEFNLYEIESEMKRIGKANLLVPILSDLKEPRLIQKIFEQYRPECIFHAAAYKHVHLVETNASAAILNNLLTLKNLIDCSLKYELGCFVLISTDKAVNPKGVMGCTKRAGELMVSQAAANSGKRFCAVRFGNVLGSSGSFIPLLKKQIREGGPVTITHPDMERYFMLIPEAVSLVLKAASLSSPGDINVLRMGNSIKILDVVTSLVALLGKKEGSVPIIFTGIRPGEKLKEELYLRGDELSTQHPDILVLPRGAQVSAESNYGVNLVAAMVDKIISLARQDDPGAAILLRSMVELNQQEEQLDRNEVAIEASKSNPNLVA